MKKFIAKMFILFLAAAFMPAAGSAQDAQTFTGKIQIYQKDGFDYMRLVDKDGNIILSLGVPYNMRNDIWPCLDKAQAENYPVKITGTKDKDGFLIFNGSETCEPYKE